MSDKYTVTSLVRAVDVLDSLASLENDGATLAELVRETDIPKSTLYRILSTLKDQQCVSYDETTKQYRLGMRLWELGNAYLNQSDFYRLAVPYMSELAETCRGSVFLGILTEGDVTYVRRMESPRSVMAVRKLGQRAPAYCTATGRAMLAFLPNRELNRLLASYELTAHTSKTNTDADSLQEILTVIRRERVAVVDGEYNRELLCVASPLLDERHRPVAAITVALLSVQTNGQHIEEVATHVREAARELSGEIGYLAGAPFTAD